MPVWIRRIGYRIAVAKLSAVAHPPRKSTSILSYLLPSTIPSPRYHTCLWLQQKQGCRLNMRWLSYQSSDLDDISHIPLKRGSAALVIPLLAAL